MTVCKGELAEKLAEQYVQGTLPESEAEAFEEHYFTCDPCYEHVRTLQTVQQELARQPVALPQRPSPWFSLGLRWAAAAAVVVIAIAGGRVLSRRHSQPPQQFAKLSAPAAPRQTAPRPSDELAKLADLSLPPYEAPRLRNAAGNREFHAGMRAYLRRDYASALKHLDHVPANAAERPAAEFYAGACQFAVRDFSGAETSLGKVANIGDSPQYEAALYYLAQINLIQNNTAAAQTYLEQIVGLRGDYEKRALGQLDSIHRVTNRR